MSASKATRDLPTIIADLRRRVARCDLSAMDDLGLGLQKGFQDKNGRSVVKKNPKKMSSCIRTFSSSDHAAPGFWLSLLCGREEVATGCGNGGEGAGPEDPEGESESRL